ncbi:hypothetical protein ThimaDRAFT_4539 [Thiocapsa marina 5811]|uniref:Uncharacterized protein n=1 Tax=Thiocapsa marina 5811 TaxID=768671 RepID=F9UHY6_9GAMM|nr:hypothetical protein ThimaDRAFT_4539 [Thiocapsa marina 5811]
MQTFALVEQLDVLEGGVLRWRVDTARQWRAALAH